MWRMTGEYPLHCDDARLVILVEIENNWAAEELIPQIQGRKPNREQSVLCSYDFCFRC